MQVQMTIDDISISAFFVNGVWHVQILKTQDSTTVELKIPNEEFNAFMTALFNFNNVPMDDIYKSVEKTFKYIDPKFYSI